MKRTTRTLSGKNPKLALNKERIRQLSPDELSNVEGGYVTPSAKCSYGCCSIITLKCTPH